MFASEQLTFYVKKYVTILATLTEFKKKLMFVFLLVFLFVFVFVFPTVNLFVLQRTDQHTRNVLPCMKHLGLC